MAKPFLPTSDLAKRFCLIMHRRLTTPWLPKEIASFRRIAPHVHEDDILMLERYYKTLWPPLTNKNILRHDLYTLLNNFNGEVDRARIWCEQHPLRSVRKIIPLPPTPSAEPFIPPQDPTDIQSLQQFLFQYAEHKDRKQSHAEVSDAHPSLAQQQNETRTGERALH